MVASSLPTYNMQMIQSYSLLRALNSYINIKKTLIIFQLASGLQVNFHKSSLMGINVPRTWLSLATASLQCKGGSLPFTYLGLSVGCDTSRLKAWDLIIDRVRKRLESWKGRLLSIGGKVTLIKASISSLPLYFMSLFPLPKGVVIENINNYKGDFYGVG